MIGGSLCLLLFMTGCKSADGAKAPVSLTWEMGAAEVQPGYYENSFILKNISDIRSWLVRFFKTNLHRSR